MFNPYAFASALMSGKRKGQAAGGIYALVGVGIALLIFGVVLNVSATVTSELYKQSDDGSIAQNVSNHTLEAFDLAGVWMSILVIVAIAAVIISMLMGFGRFAG